MHLETTIVMVSTHGPSSSPFEDRSEETPEESEDESSEVLDVDEAQADEQQAHEQAAEQLRSDRDSLRRALRDLEAAEQRVKRNAERIYEETRSSLIHDLFPVIDDLDRSIEAAQANSDPVLLEAVQMARRQLDHVIARYGAERIDANGVFDPNLHDAVTAVTVSDPAKDKTVLKQLAPGYRVGERLLRPAKVIVGLYPS